MLARFQDEPRVAEARLSWDGTRVLLRGAKGTTGDDLFAAAKDAFKPSNMVPKRLADEKAHDAWEQREAEDKWLVHDQLWKLSWREAETFADRVVASLAKEIGDAPSTAVRPALVEFFFRSVRPRDETGPTPRFWKRGAAQQACIEAVLVESAKQLEKDHVEALRALLTDGKRVRSLIQQRG